MGFYDIISWPFGQMLYLFYTIFNDNYAVSLIMFTVFAKLILLPMAVSQQKSQTKSMRARSKIEKLRKKYGSDQQRLNEELQAFYKKEGYGTMTGGCGILAIQFPIIIGLYGAIYKPLSYILRIPSAVVSTLSTQVATLEKNSNMGRMAEIKVLAHVDELRSMNPDISSAIFDKISGFKFTAFGFNLAETPADVISSTGRYMVMIVPLLSFLMAFLSSLYSYFRQKKLNVGGDKSANVSMGCMTLFMPLMSLWLAYKFPVGIGIYWAINSFLSFVQTLVLNHTHSPEKVIARMMVKESIVRRNNEAAAVKDAQLLKESSLK